MPLGTKVPCITVLMTTYNGRRWIPQSINSILSQTFSDFELLIIDDGSTDDTVSVVKQYRDPRIRLISTPGNLGVVGSRNFGLGHARGTYIATLDHDDLSLPGRLARQAAYLDADSTSVLVGTRAAFYEHGRMREPQDTVQTDPDLIRWMLHLANPLVYSSIMVRADALKSLSPVMRQERLYADDFDLYHRLLQQGRLARLDERLTIYRLHGENTFRSRGAEMQHNAALVLADAYRPWFGADADEAASLVTRLVATREAPRNLAEIGRFEHILATLSAKVLASSPPCAVPKIQQHAETVVAQVTDRFLRFGGIRGVSLLVRKPSWNSAALVAKSAVQELLPAKQTLKTIRNRFFFEAQERYVVPRPTVFMGQQYRASEIEIDRPPTLYVVVDTEAEFDWSKPFAPDMTHVKAMHCQIRAQSLLEEFGVKPVYVVDYPVASQPEGYEPLREFHGRGACEIGAHLHPWTTPPLEEEPSEANSYPGNLSVSLELKKLTRLMRVIRASFGIQPRFYKAGRYGIGPSTLAAIEALGVFVDFSILAGADLRPRKGPDFRKMIATPYRTEGSSVLSVPMTRSPLGILRGGAPMMTGMLEKSALRSLKLRGVLARLHLFDEVTLTPEGMTADEQIALMKQLYKAGHRLFVLHYHSPSLMPGGTPYVKTEADVAALLQRMERVLRYFMTELDGIPGAPRDLLPVHLRGLGDIPAYAASLAPEVSPEIL